MIPVIKGKAISNQEFIALEPKIRDAIEEKRKQLTDKFTSAMNISENWKEKLMRHLRN